MNARKHESNLCLYYSRNLFRIYIIHDYLRSKQIYLQKCLDVTPRLRYTKNVVKG